ncbi:MAG: transposase [Alcaligenes sp.]
MISFFMFPPIIRKVIYTIKAVESINVLLWRAVKMWGHFPSDGAATKLPRLVLLC